MCGSTGFLKAVVYFFNFLLSLAGLALLGLGVYSQLKFTPLRESLHGFYEIGSIACMVVGAVVFFIAFIGCCGAIRESNCLLVTYSVFIIVLIIVKLALAAVVYLKTDTVAYTARMELHDMFINNQPLFHDFETALNCCGFEGAESYSGTNPMLPRGCCAKSENYCTLTNAYSGCDLRVVNWVYTSTISLALVCGIVAAVELLAVVFGLCLAKHVRNREKSF